MYQALLDSRFTGREHAAGDRLARLLWMVGAALLLTLAIWSASPNMAL